MTKGRNESKGINKTLNFYLPVKSAEKRLRLREVEGERRREEEKQFPLHPPLSELSNATILRFYTPNTSHAEEKRLDD